MTLQKRIPSFPVWLLLAFISMLIFIPFLGNVHLFDWDEINFAESAREMLLTHTYRTVQINFQPFYEKPPFFIWLQALSMSYFGINEFAARLPNALMGIVTVLTVYHIGRKYYSEPMGIWWAMLFICSLLPQLYFKSGIIDPVFNYFIFLSLYLLFRISIKDDFTPIKIARKNHQWFLIISGLSAGAAILTKGPVALGLIVATVTVVLIINRGKMNFNLVDLVKWTMVIVVVVAAWLSFEIKANGITFIDNFIAYQIRLFTTEDAGHGGPFYYHFLALLIGCCPASILCLASIKKNKEDTLHQLLFKRWMLVMLCIVLLVFSVVKTKIIHYSSLGYFPITFLGAYYIEHLMNGKLSWTWRQTLPIFVFTFLVAAAAALGIYIGSYNVVLPLFKQDRFGVEALNAIVFWNQAEVLIPFFLIVAVVVGLSLIYKKKLVSGLATILISYGLFINIMLALIVPRIEKYSQGAMIRFLESKKTEDCYIRVIGFKSYAQLFYGDKHAPLSKQEEDDNYVLSGPVTKPVYIITKVNKLQIIADMERFEKLYSENGFVFLKRCN